MNLFVDGGEQLCTLGVCCWAFGELIINLGDCLGTIPLHELLTSTTLHRGTALIAYNTFGTHEYAVAAFVYQQQ